MFLRIAKLSKSHSFFLFGPRGSGKSTLIQNRFSLGSSIYIDLLKAENENRYRKNPDLLLNDVKAHKNKWIIIDEVQKIPKLLDLVHVAIEEYKSKFILTGSSARKLKRGGANLLAGRAFLFYLFPLTHVELADQFHLQDVLCWGSLPKIFELDDVDKKNFLVSYVQTYLKEEIISEQIIRNVEGFRNFLDVAAQMNGRALNFSKISRECGVDSKTVISYYQILEDTLMGFFLNGYHNSIRKAQKAQPKFYFFDLGVVRTLEGSLDSEPVPKTSVYGNYFECFVVNEVFRFNSYSGKDYKLSQYQTSTGQEIDLILSKGVKTILIEIKSTNKIDSTEVIKFSRISEGFKNAKRYFVSQDKMRSEIENVTCLHWKDFIKEIFGEF
jgi:predicted AAA+ superfamily ATPase